MGTLKNFFLKKAKGFYCTAAALLLTVLGVIFFASLTSFSAESTETPGLVIAFAVATIVLCLFAGVKDLFRIPTLLAFACATCTFGAFASGRVSYVAFYFSGDVMNTGLSPLFVLSALCFLLAVVASVMAVCFKQEK